MEYEGRSYGSGATIEKLDAHRRYADTFTQALLEKPSKDNLFVLHYVDAFAGSGQVRLPGGAEVVSGSALQALEVTHRPFDRLLLIDRDHENCNRLEQLIEARGDNHRTTVWRGDANVEIPRFCDWLRADDRRLHRAFVFMDPYAMQVDWKTIEAVAATKRADLLMLFPLMSLRRNLKRDGWPIPEHQTALNRFYNGDSWRSLYSTRGGSVSRLGGNREIVAAYVEDMKEVFAEVVDPQRTLGSASDGSLFTMVFGASNPDAAELPARIAKGVFNAASGIQSRMRLE